MFLVCSTRFPTMPLVNFTNFVCVSGEGKGKWWTFMLFVFLYQCSHDIPNDPFSAFHKIFDDGWKQTTVTPFEVSHCLAFQRCACLSVSHLKFLKEFHNIRRKKSILFYKLEDCKVQKSKLIFKIKCTMLLKHLYSTYYNTKLKSAPKAGHCNVFSPHWCP